jgi:hypothetical protein
MIMLLKKPYINIFLDCFVTLAMTAPKNGGEGGIRTRVERKAPDRFRVGAVMTASVPLR